jgi:hypothetical protein
LKASDDQCAVSAVAISIPVASADLKSSHGPRRSRYPWRLHNSLTIETSTELLLLPHALPARDAIVDISARRRTIVKGM